MILKDLGVQSEEDLSFITSEHAIQYVRELEQNNNQDKLKLRFRLEEIR